MNKIGLFSISFFVLVIFFIFINSQSTGNLRFGGAIPALITFGFSWFISYSKWANNNIWNKKTSKPNNTSDTSSDELVEPIDDNRDILSNINLPSLSGSNDDLKNALQKIEELKRQIEILEQAIKNNDTNSETESPELSKEYSKEKQEEIEYLNKVAIVIIVTVLVVILIMTVYG